MSSYYANFESSMYHTLDSVFSLKKALKTLDIAMKTDEENDCGDLLI